MLHTRRAFFALVALLAIASVACSDDSSSSAAGSTATSPGGDSGGAAVAATEKDFSIAIDPTEVAAGEVTFTINNEGPSAHEFVVIESDTAPGDLPVEDGLVSEDGVTVIGEAEDVAPSTTVPLTLELEAGQYVIICNLPGHYEQGMYTGLKAT
jgi:uncharacterized cupredoxin-like copper-binding protein